MQFLWHYLKHHKKTLFLALGLAAVNQIFSLLDPQVFRIIIDQYAQRADDLTRGEFVGGVLTWLGVSVLVALISRVAKNFQDYNVNMISQKVGTAMYADAVDHSFSLPYAVFEDQRSGELLQKLQKARSDSQALLTSFVNTVFLSAIGILFVLIYSLTVYWLIALIYFLMIPLMGVVTFFMSKKIRNAQAGIIREMADLAGSTTETLRNVQLVKSLGLEKQEISRLNQVNDTILGLELKKIKLIRMFSFSQGTLINAMRALLLLLLLYLLFQKIMTLGEFFSIYIYSFFIFSPLYELSTVATQFQEAKASIAQLQKILEIKKEKIPDSAVMPDALEHIELKAVEFKYAASSQPVLHSISANLRAGQTVAFVGPSGSGKSTIMKLLVGLYQPTAGHVRYNSIDSKNVDFFRFRKKIGLVAQETQLFSGTIRENLLFVNPDASDAECLAVIKLAAAEHILERGGQGLNTKIGEGGIKISGGERQRLAIARALLRQPELIIFDEATSSLDSITEEAITKTIQSIEKNNPHLITVLVAHRLSTVAHAKTIYVLEKGSIVEQGTHDQLIKQGGLYSALWRQQIAVHDPLPNPALL